LSPLPGLDPEPNQSDPIAFGGVSPRLDAAPPLRLPSAVLCVPPAESLGSLGVALDAAAKIPDVIVHYTAKNWLLLIETVASAGPVDGRRRKELKNLFAGCKASLVFVTAFETRRTMRPFVSHIA
jgi:hypothetical protein